MGNVSRYGAIQAKSKSMERDLLKDEDFIKLLEAPDYQTALDYLAAETVYGQLIDSKNTYAIEDVEALLKQYLFKQYEKLFHYFVGEDRKFYKILFMRFEIENLKVFLRMLIRKEALSNISDHIIAPKQFGKLPYTALGEARSLEDLISALEGTEYQKIIQMFKDEEEDKLMFYLEMNLDRLYFTKLYKQVKRLDLDNKRAVGEIVGRNIDMLNLQWIYRGRRFYKISQEELVNYSLPGGKHFKFADLKDMIYRENLHDVETIIRQSAYGSLFEDTPNFEIFLERSMERYVYGYINMLRLSYPMTLVEPMRYMHYLEYEIRDLITLLETKRYNISTEEARQFLVRHMK